MATKEHLLLPPKDQYHPEDDRVPERWPAGRVECETQDANTEEEGVCWS